MPDKIHKPIDTNKCSKGTSIVPVILLMIGTVFLFVFIFPLAAVWEKDFPDVATVFWCYIMPLLVLASFILFSIGLFWYTAKKMKRRASFGWWLFSIGIWFEIFLVRYYAPRSNRIVCFSDHTGTHWCESTVDTHSLALYFIIPAILMLLGLILVFIRKRNKTT